MEKQLPLPPGPAPVRTIIVMSLHRVTFDVVPDPIQVPTGTLLSEALQQAGIDINQPCGGQGRCGRCIVQVVEGTVRRRSTLRLSPADIESGFALACQTAVEGDASVVVPPQEKIERRLTTDRTVAEVTVPADYDNRVDQTVQRVRLTLKSPSMDDQTDDWSRLQTAFRQQAGYQHVKVSLSQLQSLGTVLRAGEWDVTAVVDVQDQYSPEGAQVRLISLLAGQVVDSAPLWGAAIDIGTTTVTLWLVNLINGQVRAQVSEYNGQIARGEDVISRIVYASKGEGREEMRSRVLDTINTLLETACKRANIQPDEVMKATVAGNSTMIHLLLGIPAASIRLAPFVTAINQTPSLPARDVGLRTNPEATVDCLPGVASYVGADITAGVLATGLDDSPEVTLFVDIGTNGEIVLGSRDWMVTCACSAGPAFEGAGVVHGMRATKGAIEEVWISGPGSPKPYEPTNRVIGNVKPRGICGSGLISLIAEMFMTGVIDKGGGFNTHLDTERIREGEHGLEYVVAWGPETETGQDIVITRVDVDNFLRAKAAIYAGYTVLAESVGVPLEAADQMLVGGSFGKYINVEKAVQIGLLPDIPWERFQFLGNTAVRGAYYALLDRKARERLSDIASRMTYIELSADNTFYEAFMSALFLPHTDLFRFPTVEAALEGKQVVA